ncbi:MAG TPA: hypothetical protein VMW17_22370 [Candidatus Binatia bacterium]|nr:hypothetical protein [Candidatus Binatia bacterium]
MAGLVAATLAVAAPVQAGDPIAKCKQTIASASAKFEETKLAALQKCEAAKLSGKKAAGTDCHQDTTTAALISKALTTAKASITKDCSAVGLSSTGFSGLVKRCSAGDRWGGPCALESECPGICVGGAKDTQSCSFTSSCNNRTCTKASCVSGDVDKLNTNCTSDADCFDDHVVHALGACPFGYECGQPGGPGLCNAGPLVSKVCTGDSDCNKNAVAGDCNMGTCIPTSPNPGHSCSTTADCNYAAPANTCDAGCGANTSTADCKAGYCDQALCSSNKDCGICNAVSGVLPPNFNEPCAGDSDCGKVCSHTAAAHADLPCKADSDCGGTVGACAVLATSCSTGTCSGGFCASGNLNGHARATTGLCAAVDRCPTFENNKEPGVMTCDGGPNNGQTCTGAGSCADGMGHHGKECNNTFADCTTDADCGTGACVDRCQPGCGFPINNATAATDIGNCLACIGEASVDQIDSIVAGQLKPAAKVCVGGDNPGQTCASDSDCPGTKPGKCKAMDPAVDKCRSALATAAATFFQTKRAILEKCEEGIVKGTVTPPCPDTPTATAIGKAETKLLTTVAKSCGGKDGLFESDPNAKPGAINLDLKPDQASGLFTCPNLPGPASCTSIAGQPINTAEDLAKCLDCLVEFKVDCTDRIATPSLGALPAFCNPTCGNGKIDGTCTGGSNAGNACLSSLDCPGGICTPIETCDDSNSVSGDTCPASCNIASCAPSGSTRTVIVTVSAPAGTDLEGLSVLVTYPDGTVGIPGQSNDTSVVNRVIFPSGGGNQSVNDLNYGIRLSNVGAPIPSVAFAVNMDTCTGASPATSDQFRCLVESATDSGGGALTDVTCHVIIL